MVTFSGASSVLQANFFPEVELKADSNYSGALLDLIIHGSENISEITQLDVIRVVCDVISESYINGEQSRIIHQFATSASHVNGQTIAEIPKHISYLPIKTKHLRSIQIKILDRNGGLVNIHGGNIICRIHIRRDDLEKST